MLSAHRTSIDINVWKDMKQKHDEQTQLSELNNTTGYGTQYGYMQYEQYYRHDVLITEYVIHKTTPSLSILQSIHNLILKCLSNNTRNHYLFYRVDDVDARLVTYDIIKNHYPYLIIKIKNRYNRNIVSFKGNKGLYTILYNELIFLNQYNLYYTQCKSLSYSQLCHNYNDIYGNPHHFYINKRNRVISALLDNEKCKFITNY